MRNALSLQFSQIKAIGRLKYYKDFNTVQGKTTQEEPMCMTGTESLWKDEQKFKTHPYASHLLTSLTKMLHIGAVLDIVKYAAYQ